MTRNARAWRAGMVTTGAAVNPSEMAGRVNGCAVLRCAPALRVTRPASRTYSNLSRRRESETVMRIPTLVTVPSPGKRGRRLRPSLVGEGYRSGLGQTDSLGPPGRSDTYGLPGGVPVGLVATCQSLLRGSGEAEGDREVRVEVV